MIFSFFIFFKICFSLSISLTGTPLRSTLQIENSKGYIYIPFNYDFCVEDAKLKPSTHNTKILSHPILIKEKSFTMKLYKRFSRVIEQEEDIESGFVLTMFYVTSKDIEIIRVREMMFIADYTVHFIAYSISGAKVNLLFNFLNKDRTSKSKI